MPRRQCQKCKKYFSGIASKKFCSIECKNDWHLRERGSQKSQRKPHRAFQEAEAIRFICFFCGKDYEPTGNHQIYCSRECKLNHRYEKLRKKAYRPYKENPE